MNGAGIFKKLDSIVIRVVDLQKAREWYEQKFGFTEHVIDKSEKMALLDFGGTTGLILWQIKPEERLCSPDSLGTYPVFLVDDIQKAFDILIERNVAVKPIDTFGGMKLFQLFDLDGNMLEVHQRSAI